MRKSNHFDQLRLVGNISLWFSLVAGVGLLAVVWIAGSSSDDYVDQIQNLAATRRNLPFVMLSGGLLLAIGTGITTWLITLYSTFRVAGPLYRFSKNLEAGVMKGEVPRISIRRSDHLQAENQLLQDSVSTLYQHYSCLDQAAEQLVKQLDPHLLELNDAELEASIGRLRDIEQRARCD
ncbi:MAG: hypothetical protein V7752_08440 [Halopseudomonas sp.]